MVEVEVSCLPLDCALVTSCSVVTSLAVTLRHVEDGGPCEMAGRKWREMAGRANSQRLT